MCTYYGPTLSSEKSFLFTHQDALGCRKINHHPREGASQVSSNHNKSRLDKSNLFTLQAKSFAEASRRFLRPGMRTARVCKIFLNSLESSCIDI